MANNTKIDLDKHVLSLGESFEALWENINEKFTRKTDNTIPTRTVFVYKTSTTQPGKPIGGSWDNKKNTIVYPENNPDDLDKEHTWGGADNIERPIWMSVKTFATEPAAETEWSLPTMISGENAPTKGTAVLCGMDMMKEPVKVRRLLGMCPQSHALLDLLTVREHLELFGRIKGVPPADLNDVIEYRMEDMGIKQYEHKKAQSLSGGNKRKLSVAQALIGNPPLVLMDEPSTGMDPVSRRALWDIISMVSAKRKECTIIITTHSMEEAEALCTKVGIMVGGRLRCFGTIQDLKSKFGHGYTLNTKFCEPSDDEVDGVLASLTVTQDTITRDHVKEILAALDTPDLV